MTQPDSCPSDPHSPDRVDVILDYLREQQPGADLSAKAVAIRLSRAAHWIELQTKRHLAPLGIEVWELDILATAARLGGSAPISALQDSSQVTGSAITNRITRLERGGYVTRAIDPADRRQIVVSLTADGRARAATVIKANDAAQREALHDIDPLLLSRLADDLRTLLAWIDARRADGEDLTGGS